MINAYHKYILHPFWNILNGLKNIIRWTPIIWYDRDWDFDYTLRILITKLEFQKNTLLKNSLEEDDSLLEKIDDMDEVIELLLDVSDQSVYEDPAYTEYTDKWGHPDYYFIPSESNPGSFEMKDRLEERYTEEQLEQRSNDLKFLLEEAHNERVSDYKKALSIIRKKSDGWWY